MIKFLTRLVGAERAVPVLIFGLMLLLLIVSGTVYSCTRPDDAAEQARQTTLSGEAIANAADNAVETVDNRAVTESDIDNAARTAMEEVGNATDLDSMRNAVLDGVCGQSSHYNDPACRVR
jgi:hypothetical protein